ncbi:hypothetical protein COJ85_03940 [Bacillus sp. AFS076308]|uniref:hypothetical protein n=1 Tax=unclassified Bacillus (in: firmicutes) TaxID=185979 RepID=UPI000BF47EB6|nr:MULTISPECIES: hypothetical protein [unclassified Bacillus (in: firmicutes)]PFO08399.1 hypothetical protein COJ85_03940 [Bacillus sp. AFS076308]PGV50592.1 hypothetical protein COD92_16750 [Bacillus sp. AFS037270]
MSYHIMLTRKISDIKGHSQIQVQVMDAATPQIIYFTLDELEKDDLPEDLKEYIRGILSEIEEGRWHYSGKYK